MAGPDAQERFVRSLAESRLAEQFIRDLYAQRRPHGDAGSSDANGKSLAKALKLLSSELYSKTTQFLLELIQNADDATYPPGVEPTINFVLRPDGHVWIGSNEVGFTKDNVEAICDLAGSTKTITDHQKGYIGEKGIGFKATFSCADKVWISSGPYRFSLGRNDLEMISPVWEPFRHTAMLDERTMFCLHVPLKEDLANVQKEMLGLKPELLLFLRKLRKINIKIADDEDHIVHEFSLRREDNTDDIKSGYTTTQLSRNDQVPSVKSSSARFAVFRHTTNSMPEEPKRAGIKRTEIVLAFPTVLDGSSQMTFNFLPIRDFGLRVLLHADFILNVNREDISHGNLWNLALLAAVGDLFEQCITIFNKAKTDQMQVFKYTWPQFAQSTHTAPGTIMAEFSRKLCERLSKVCVLETRAGLLAAPASLTILSKRWFDKSTPPIPLFGELVHMKQYVSEKYVQEELSGLKVKSQTPGYFATLLKKMEPGQLQHKPEEWHCRVAEAMTEIPPVSAKQLGDIKIIPLRDGRWISMAKEDHSIYFPDIHNEVDIPAGIELQVVEPSAVNDSHRRKLLELLGVQSLDHKQVCQLILRRHDVLGGPADDLSLLPVDILVDHTRYLYKYRDCMSFKRLRALKFATAHSDCAVIGNEILYMDSIIPNTFLMSSHFESSEECQFLHPAYLEDIAQATKQHWHEWLRDVFGISTKPKLIKQQNVFSALAAQYDAGTLEFGFHPLFQLLVDLPNSMIWLSLLRDEWSEYKADIDHLPKNYLQHTLVTCRDGTRSPLNEVYLATTEILKEPLALTGVKLLEITDRDKSWRELSTLGLKRKADLEFYLGILHKAANGEVEADFSDVIRLMQGIQRHAEGFHHIIRKRFEIQKLIAIPYNGSLSWLGPKDCKWRAPDCLLGVTALSGHYDEGELFFNQVLEVDDATADDIAEQLDLNAGDLDVIANTKELLVALSDHVQGNNTHMDFSLDLLRRIAIFPVWQVNGKRDLVASDDGTWFLADDYKHQKNFQGKVALLDWAIRDIPRLLPLLKLLGVTQRALSTSVVEEWQLQAKSRLLTGFSAELQSKAKYIALLVPSHKRIVVESQLQKIEVYASRKMKLSRHVQIGGRSVYGTAEFGKAMMREHEARLQLYCRNIAIKEKRVPWHFVIESMSKLLGIPEQQQQTLTLIFVTLPGPLIEEILSSKGLWDEAVSDIDDVGEEDELEDDLEDDLPTVRTSDHQAPRNGDDESDDDLLFVSEHKKSETSPEDSDADAEDDEATEGTSESPQAVNSTQQSSRPRRKISKAVFKKGPSAAQVKAQREKDAIAAVLRAAAGYEMEEVKVYGPTRGTSHPPGHLAGLTFEKTKALNRYPDQIDSTRYHGELFIRKILSWYTACTDDVWTSPMRSRQNLDKTDIDVLNESSTFTIIGSELCDIISEWLDDIGYNPRNSREETPDTYHIYVKATEGSVNQPFTLSNQEFDLAQQWSASETDQVLIFRVYELRKKPHFVVLVDPAKLMQSDQVAMTAIDGFDVRISS